MGRVGETGTGGGGGGKRGGWDHFCTGVSNVAYITHISNITYSLRGTICVARLRYVKRNIFPPGGRHDEACRRSPGVVNNVKKMQPIWGRGEGVGRVGSHNRRCGSLLFPPRPLLPCPRFDCTNISYLSGLQK